MILVTFFIVVGQFVGVFWLAQAFSKHLFRLLILVTRSQKAAVWLASLLLFPGTLLHELSHWVTAEVLQVPTGSIHLLPEVIEGQGIRMGSVKIAKTDPFRRTMIGLAPIVVGMTLISAMVQVLPSPVWQDWQDWQMWLVVIAIWLVTNTMFSSKKDLEAAMVPLIMLIITVAAWWWFEWSLPLAAQQAFQESLRRLQGTFWLVIGINLGFFVLVKVLIWSVEKLTGRRLVVQR